MLTKDEFLKPLAALRTSEVVITTMGMVRPWARLSRSDLDFASADSSMGHAADLALGIALAQPQRKVICLNGDGSMMMSLGTLITAVDAQAANLILFVVQNDTYEITGNQPVPGAGRLDWTRIAEGAGFPCVYFFEDEGDYATGLKEVLNADGPAFACVLVEKGKEGPIERGPQIPEEYLTTSLAESAHRLRAALRSGG